jgi:uncharacterized protein (TIGR02594 family)
MLRWLSVRIGDKPAWAIVAGAVLTAIGGAIAALIVSGGHLGAEAIRQALTGGPKFNVFVREAGTSRPIDGVTIRLLDAESLQPIALGAKGERSLTTAEGVAHATTPVKPGSYSLRAEYRRAGLVYGRFDPVEITGSFNHTLEFDPQTWFNDRDAAVTILPVTAATTAALPPIPAGAPWMRIAEQEIGQQEAPGAPSNPRVVEYLDAIGLSGVGDEIPWNSAFVGWVMTKSGYTVPASSPGAARSWLSWGKPAALTPGCIAVFWRGTPERFTGHVGFFVSEDGVALKVLGGNQADSVNIARIDRSRLLSCRVPTEAERAG